MNREWGREERDKDGGKEREGKRYGERVYNFQSLISN